jgi:ABC-type transport system involved in cytochrome bd biosynthesis fused ATPase/permease subunit
MNQRRLIFLSIFGVYQLCILLFVIYIEKQKEITSLIALYKKITWFKYGAFLGIALFLTELIWTWWDARRNKKTQEDLRYENNSLKAKVYDYQQAEKKVVADKTVQPK